MKNRKTKLIAVFLFVLLFSSCAKQGIVEFAELTQNHKELSEEICGSMINSIKDDLEERRKNNNLSSDLEQSANDLIYSLQLIRIQSILIDQYTKLNMVDEEFLNMMQKATRKERNE